MVNGIVKWYDKRKGYGFVTPEDTPKGVENSDIFIHYLNIKMAGYRVLYEGDKVTFDIEIVNKGKGKEARNLRVFERAIRSTRQGGSLKEDVRDVYHTREVRQLLDEAKQQSMIDQGTLARPLEDIPDIVSNFKTIIDHSRDKTTIIKNSSNPTKKNVKEAPDN